MGDLYLTPAELAVRWRRNPRSVLRWIAADEIPALKIGGRPLISVAWIEAQERAALGEFAPAAPAADAAQEPGDA